MNRILLALILAVSCVQVVFSTEINVTKNAMCSPVIGTNNGTVTINCTDPELEMRLRNLPDLSNYNSNISELMWLRKNTSRMKTRLQAVEEESHISKNNISTLRTNLHQAEKRFSTLWREHEKLRSQLAKTLSNTSEIMRSEINAVMPSISASIAQVVYDQHFKEFSQFLYYDIDQKLKTYRDNLDKLKDRVDSLQYDVSFLMNEFLEGNLKENVGFYGLSIGGINLSDAWQPRIGLEYEMLMPTLPLLGVSGSWFVELAHLDWKETQTYHTLPGLSPVEIEENNEFTLFSLGTRLFIFRWKDHVQPYLGMALGHSVPGGAENTYSYSISIGMEYFRQTSRVAVELRWDGFSDIEREETTFNPFGNAMVDTITEARDGWYAGIKVAFR